MNGHHYFRTTIAGILGTIASSMIMLSILVVWANRTLTDTATYTQTVAPLVTQPEVQQFVADKLVAQAMGTETGAPASPAAEKPDVDEAALRAGVKQVLESPRVAALWRDTNASQHAELMRQLDANGPEVVLDFNPLVIGVLDEVKQTQLAPLVEKAEIQPGMARIDLKGSLVERVRDYYHGLQTATWVVLLTTLVTAGLSVWASVHHLKTLRRVLVGTAVSAGLIAAVVAAPTVLPVGDVSMQPMVAALSRTLFHNLQVACLVIAGVAVVAAIGTKLWERRTGTGRAAK